MIHGRQAPASLDRLQDLLEPPSHIGSYQLNGLVTRTETALVYAARGGLFGRDEGILKLTSSRYAPLLERELALLVRCAHAEVDGVIRPSSAAALRARLTTGLDVVAMALPRCGGGTLLEVIAGRESRGLGSGFALEIGLAVACALRGLLALQHPLVHGDVRPANVMLPSIDADLAQLTLIDFDAARELTAALPAAAADAGSAAVLTADVRGFGELLYQAATGYESANRPPLSTGNRAFDALVRKCLSSTPEVDDSYVCLADQALWDDLRLAQDAEAGGPTRHHHLSSIWRR